MQYYDITMQTLPGQITVYAQNENKAVKVFQAWHKPRFRMKCGDFIVERSARSTTDTGQSAVALPKRKQAGVVAWLDPVGWVVIPPEMEAPGPYYQEASPVSCFGFIPRSGGPKQFVFAACRKNAELIHATWVDLHGMPDPMGFAIVENVEIPESDADGALHKAISLQATGILSDVNGVWNILPPWDELAGTYP